MKLGYNLMKCSYLSTITLFIQCSISVHSQELPRQSYCILNDSVYRKGIYQTFEEFKYNRPSIVDNYTFDRKNLWLTNPQTGRKKKIRKRNVWGWNDGHKIYVSWRKYDELLEQGRYCYFIDKGTRIGFLMSGFPLAIIPVPVWYHDEMIIDFNTGETEKISKLLLKDILLTDDPELLEQFNKERQKGRKLLEYVKKFNDRNVATLHY